MHTYKLANSIFDGPITTLLSILCILVEIFSPAHVKMGKSLNGFKFGTSIGRFLSDSAANMAVKGLMTFRCHVMVQFMVINGWKTSSVVLL